MKQNGWWDHHLSSLVGGGIGHHTQASRVHSLGSDLNGSGERSAKLMSRANRGLMLSCVYHDNGSMPPIYRDLVVSRFLWTPRFSILTQV